MKYSLIKEYNQILEEEISVIKRKSNDYKTELFDIDVDEVSGSVSGRKVDVPDEVNDYLNIYNNYCSDSELKLLDFLDKKKEEGISLRVDISSLNPKEVVSYLNNHFKETVNWSPNKDKNKGRGEIALHLAFNSNTEIREPDFVSHDNSVKIGVKSFIDKNGKSVGVRSLGTNLNIIKIFDKISKKVFNENSWKKLFSSDLVDVKLKSYMTSVFQQTVNKFIIENNDYSKEDKIKKLHQLQGYINEIKKELVKEHNTNYIIGINKRGKFFFINNRNYKNIGIFRIQKSSEINYCYIQDTRTRTFTNVIEDSLNKLNNIQENKKFNLKKVYKDLF